MSGICLPVCGVLIFSGVRLCNNHKTSALSSASAVLVAYLLLAVGVMKVHCGCNAFGVRCSSSLLLAVGVMKVQCGSCQMF